MTIECVDIQDLDCTRLRLGQTEKHSWAYKDHNTQVMKSSSTLHCKLLYLFENDHDEYSRKYMLHKLPTELYESIMDYVLEPSKFGLLLKNVPTSGMQKSKTLFLEMNCQDVNMNQLDESLRNLFEIYERNHNLQTTKDYLILDLLRAMFQALNIVAKLL